MATFVTLAFFLPIINKSNRTTVRTKHIIFVVVFVTTRGNAIVFK